MISKHRTRALLALSPLLTLALFAGHALAADRVDLGQQDLAALKSQSSLRSGGPQMNHARHADLVQLDADSRLVLMKRHADYGVRNHRYQQTYRGVPIFGEHVVVSEDSSGTPEALFGRRVTGLAADVPSVVAGLSKAQALALGKRAALGNRSLVENQESELTIYVDDAGRGHLAYLVSYNADIIGGGSPTRPFILVDANSGKVLKQWEGLNSALIGTGPGGNTKIGKHEYGTTAGYGFNDVAKSGNTCTMNNTNVKTVNLNHGTGESNNTAYSYACPRNTVKSINGAYSPLNDAHYYGSVVFNMYKAYMDAAPLTTQLVLKVHYGNGHENAHWTGSVMLFGDGKDIFYPLVNVGIVAHEASHGYTGQHSKLVYSNQSGGINEAFSDAAGETAEYFNNGTNDWMAGAQITKVKEALRFFKDPTRDGKSIGHARDYKDGMNVHNSSGVYNRAFYLIANSPGWNTKTAFQAYARANRDYWTASSTFDQGAPGVVKAACDMKMKGQDVITAFTTVGVKAGALPANCDGGGGGDEPKTYKRTKDVPIPDAGKAVTSKVTVAGRTGNGGSATPVKISIVHPNIGDLTIDLVAPDGTAYNLHNKTGGSADNINKTVNLNLSGEALNGAWRLRAQDGAAGNTGKINAWSITF